MERIKAAISKAKLARGTDEGVMPPTSRVAEPARRAHADTWDRLEEISIDPAVLLKNRIVTFSKDDPAHVPFDILRTKITKLFERNNWKSIAITSPTMACGKTLIASNLAFSFARQKTIRTVLADVDLRRPQLRKVLGIDNKLSMGDFLRGELGVEEYFKRMESNLAVGTTFQSYRHSAELLQDERAATSLSDMLRQLAPDVVIYDLPPMLASDDVMSFLEHVDCALLIAAAGITTVRELDECEKQLADLTGVAGVILNKYDLKSEAYYEYDYVY
jgi:protein-tyrosine kinase